MWYLFPHNNRQLKHTENIKQNTQQLFRKEANAKAVDGRNMRKY